MNTSTRLLRVIFSTDSGLFWHNQDGWVSLNGVTIFEGYPETMPGAPKTTVLLMLDEAPAYAYKHRFHSKNWDVTDLLDETLRDMIFLDESRDRREFMKNLAPGDQVFWQNPGEGYSSGFYKVVAIDDKPDQWWRVTTVYIENDAGSVAKVWMSELS